MHLETSPHPEAVAEPAPGPGDSDCQMRFIRFNLSG